MQVEHVSSSRKLADFIVQHGLAPGTTYTYKELEDASERPIRRDRGPIYSARTRLEAEHQRTLVCVYGVGYRVAHPGETPEIVRGRVGRARKQVRRGLHTASHTDRSALTQEERQELDQSRSGLLALERQMRQVTRRVSTVETRVDTMEVSTDERLQRLEEELRELRGGQQRAA